MRRCVYIFAAALLALASCSFESKEEAGSSCDYARYFDVVQLHAGDTVRTAVVTFSPYNASADTLVLERPLDRLICMSSSQVAGLAEIEAENAIAAVSGLKYITNKALHDRNIPDIGYEAFLDYEKVLELKPDVVLAYTVSGAEPLYLSRLRSLGVRVLVLHDHLENHPLARAEYIRLYGALTGHQIQADSSFAAICARYDSLAVGSDSQKKFKVLMNVPYGDAWYIPGGDSYMSRLVRDAGGEVMGSRPGTAASRVVSLEEAYKLSQSADIWLNPGPCRSREDLMAFHHSFRMFGPVEKGLPIYNNTLRVTPEGGNDFWESGSVRPDLILKDLIAIFSEPEDSLELEYHFKVK